MSREASDLPRVEHFVALVVAFGVCDALYCVALRVVTGRFDFGLGDAFAWLRSDLTSAAIVVVCAEAAARRARLPVLLGIAFAASVVVALLDPIGDWITANGVVPQGASVIASHARTVGLVPYLEEAIGRHFWLASGFHSLGVAAAARLKGRWTEGLALAVPDAVFWSYDTATVLSAASAAASLLGFWVAAAGLALLLPLTERAAVWSFRALGVRPAEAS